MYRFSYISLITEFQTKKKFQDEGNSVIKNRIGYLWD